MTVRVGIIGYPLAHSLSPAMHNAAFEALGMDWSYDTMAIPADIIHLGLREPQRHGYVGVNVTIPHKEAVTKYVTLDERARAIGAVNTIDFRSNQGTNTDVVGFIDDLRAHDVHLKGVNVVVLGAGGAARAAVYGLLMEGANVTVVNRTRERAQQMLTSLAISAGIKSIPVRTLQEAVDAGFELVVNCTSAGMYPKIDASPWSDDVLIPTNVTVYDMVYRPAQTRLMRQFEEAGGQAIGGLGMLVRQGAEAFKIWTGVEPPIDVMFDALKKGLTE